jgi:deoxycitidine kinase
MSTNKQIISIEGNIGAGKSTFVQLLLNYISNCIIVDEPVEVWKKLQDLDGSNILEKFYKDIPRWAYSFQNLACITRMMKIEDTIRQSDAEFIFLDRSLGTDKNVFEKMLYDSKKISEIEHQMYNLWCDFYHKYVRAEFNNIIIYLRCEPKTALARIKKRGRIEEQDIGIEYLTSLHEYHEKWLMNNPDVNVIVVNCDEDFETDFQHQTYVINTVVNKINLIKKNILNDTTSFCSIKNKIYIEEESDNENIITK